MALFHVLWMLALAYLIKVVVASSTPVAPVAAASQLEGPAAPTPIQVGETGPQRQRIASASDPQTLSIPARAAHQTFEAFCETQLPPTRIEVELAPQDVAYDFSQSIGTLTSAAQKGEDGVILGLTKNGLGTQFSWHMNLLADPLSGRACMRPQIRMQVATGAQHVFVAREFQDRDCAFREVLEHENQHVSANRDQLALAALDLRRVLKKTLGNRVFYGTRVELERQLTEAVNEHWMPMARLKLSESSPVHAEIDSEHGYRDVLSRCESEFAQVLRSLKR